MHFFLNSYLHRLWSTTKTISAARAPEHFMAIASFARENMENMHICLHAALFIYCAMPFHRQYCYWHRQMAPVIDVFLFAFVYQAIRLVKDTSIDDNLQFSCKIIDYIIVCPAQNRDKEQMRLINISHIHSFHA